MRKVEAPARRASNHDGASHSHQSDAAQNGANKRERILAAALRLFANQTYQAVTMDRVAEAAGVAKGTLYLYFPSKEELYLGIFSDGLESVSKRYQSITDPRHDIAMRLRNAIDVSIQFYDERRDLLKLIATEEPRLAEARNRLKENWRERGFVFFTGLSKRACAAGCSGRPILASRRFRSSARFARCCFTTAPAQSVQGISQEMGNFFVRGLVPLAGRRESGSGAERSH